MLSININDTKITAVEFAYFRLCKKAKSAPQQTDFGSHVGHNTIKLCTYVRSILWYRIFQTSNNSSDPASTIHHLPMRKLVF